MRLSEVVTAAAGEARKLCTGGGLQWARQGSAGKDTGKRPARQCSVSLLSFILEAATWTRMK